MGKEVAEKTANYNKEQAALKRELKEAKEAGSSQEAIDAINK